MVFMVRFAEVRATKKALKHCHHALLSMPFNLFCMMDRLSYGLQISFTMTYITGRGEKAFSYF